ncbi:hypothetical protein NFI96_007735 [Prochilodus magdalenae]|nr:hypothetical protein NFI96_007735 [Prochilodus magdalenae]
MAVLLMVFILQLLFGTSRPCLLQRTSAGLRSVHPGDNITLHCDITVEYDIWWYHQSSEEMMVLITAGKGRLSKSFSLNYNLNEDHYDGIMNSSSVDLVIVGVGETDLGLYYCGGRNNTNHIQFGKAIRLNFRDYNSVFKDRETVPGGGDIQSNSSSAHMDYECSSPDPAPYQITTAVLASVCLISVLTNFIMFCNRVQGKYQSVAIVEDSTEKCKKCKQYRME